MVLFGCNDCTTTSTQPRKHFSRIMLQFFCEFNLFENLPAQRIGKAAGKKMPVSKLTGKMGKL